MARTKSINSNYQSLYLWTSFLLGMISLGIIIWNRRSVIPAQTGTQVNSVTPKTLRNFIPNYLIESPRVARDDCFISTGQINFSRFASSVVLSALIYQQIENSFAGTLTLLCSTVVGATFLDKRQVSQEFTINNYSIGTQFQPYVIKLGNSSDFAVTWSSDTVNGSNFRSVYAGRFNHKGVSITGDIIVKANTKTDHPNPSIGALSDPGFIVSWRAFNQTAPGWSVHVKLYPSNNLSSNNNFQVNSENSVGGIAGTTRSIISNPLATEFIIVWESTLASNNFNNYGRVYSENGYALTDVFQINNYTKGQDSTPSGTFLSNKAVIIVWNNLYKDNSGYGISARLYTYPGLFSSEFIVNQFTQNAQVFPIAIPFVGEFVILWKSQGPEVNSDPYNPFEKYDGVYGRLFDNNGTALSGEFRINFHTLTDWYGLSATPLDEEHFVAVWRAFKDRTKGTYDVYGQVCSKVGDRIGPEFLVNNPVYSVFGDTSVDALDNNTFVIVWDSVENGDIQIKARIFTLTELGIDLLPPASAPIVTSITNSLTTITSVLTETTSTNLELSSSNNNPNIVGYVGTAVGACIFGGFMGVIGFFAVNKCRKSKPPADSNKTEIALQNKNTIVQQSNRHYGEMDATREASHQYDRPVDLKI